MIQRTQHLNQSASTPLTRRRHVWAVSFIVCMFALSHENAVYAQGIDVESMVFDENNQSVKTTPFEANVFTDLSTPTPKTRVQIRSKRRILFTFQLPEPFFETTHTHSLYEAHTRGHTILRFVSSPKGQAAALEEESYETWIQISSRSSKAHLIWSGAVDPIDPSVEISLNTLDEDGVLDVIQTQRSPHPTLCGARAWTAFFPNVWDFKTRRFVHAPPLSKATRITPSLSPSQDPSIPQQSRLTTLSTFRSASSNHNHASRSPRHLSDQNPDTLWIEGDDGWGLGSYVNARVNPFAPLQALRINTPKDPAYASPSLLLLTFSDNTSYQVRLPPPQETTQHLIVLPQPIVSSCLSVTLLSVYTPKHRNGSPRTALADVTPISSLDLIPPQEATQLLLNDILKRSATQYPALLKPLFNDIPGKHAPTLILSTLRTELSKPTPQLRSIIPLLAVLPHTEARSFLDLLLTSPNISRQDLSTLQRTLTIHTPHLTSVLFDTALSPPKTTAPDITRETIQERATLVLSRACPPDQLHNFIPLLGTGSPTMRRAAIRTLSRAPISVAPAILKAASENPNSERTHDALWALERILKRTHSTQTSTLPNTAAFHAIYRDSSSIQTRIRTLQTLRRLHDASSVPFLISVLQSDDDIELRSLAARNLASYTQPDSTNALILSLEDVSPTIRMEAITALRNRADLPEVSKAAVSYTKREAWNDGLKSAYELLARSPFEDAIDTLYNVISRTSSNQSLVALHALFRARKNIRSEPLTRIVQDEKVHNKVRLKAIKALTWTRDDISYFALLSIAKNPKQDLSLRNAALRAVGQRAEERAVPHILQVAQTTKHERLQMTAVRVLAYSTSQKTLFALRKIEPKVSNRVKKVIQQSISIMDTRIDLRNTDEKLKN